MAELRTCLGVLFLLSFSPAQAFGRITQLPRRTAPVGATSIPAVAAAAVRPWEAPAPRDPQPESRPIIIDAGHGGEDWGAMITGRYEKDITLAVARKLRDRLQAQGLGPVRMTRDSDEFIPLNGRVDETSAWGGGLFISLHANKVFRRGPHGIVVYSFGRGHGRGDRHHRRRRKVPPLPAPPSVQVRAGAALGVELARGLRREGLRVESVERAGYYVLKNPPHAQCARRTWLPEQSGRGQAPGRPRVPGSAGCRFGGWLGRALGAPGSACAHGRPAGQGRLRRPLTAGEQNRDP